MSDDLVKRLRKPWFTNGCEQYQREAADRIEALEAQLAEARDYRQGVFETLNDYAKDNAALKASNDRLREQLAEANRNNGTLINDTVQMGMARDEAIAQLAEAQARPVGVKVKPLVWEDASFSNSPRETAESLLGTYEVLQWAGGDFGGSVPADDPDESETEFGGAVSMEEAKAAAQADYERRIRDALEPAPVGVEEAARVLLDAADNGLELLNVDGDNDLEGLAVKWSGNRGDAVMQLEIAEEFMREALRALSGEAGE